MRPTILLAALAMVLLAGCEDALAGTLPVDWDQGHELQAHSTARYHSGGYQVSAYPTENVSRPDHCIAYRGEEAFQGDMCRLIDEDSSGWSPADDQSWGLTGEWKGRFDDTADQADPDRPRILVAYDAEGAVVAHWDGAVHPDAVHATE